MQLFHQWDHFTKTRSISRVLLPTSLNELSKRHWASRRDVRPQSFLYNPHSSLQGSHTGVGNLETHSMLDEALNKGTHYEENNIYVPRVDIN